jgi:predicted Zn-dependent peptidase
MSIKIHTRKLANGLQLQAVEMPGTNVVTTLILAGAGSRYEDISLAGISHFLEHMFFKGAKKYTTPKAVSQAVDSFGGEFNAFTGKEYAGYYVKSGKENLEKAVDVLSDMLLHSKFDPIEINKERGVILEEMAMYLDAPMYQISWDFENLVFGDQPLGRDQIGTKDLIKTVTQEMFQDYQKELYTPDNLVITVAGAVNESTLDLLEKNFTFANTKKTRTAKPFDPNITTEPLFIREKKTEQYHISVGTKGIPETSEDYPALKVLATILGGNMSSRMFQRVREEKGLCYSVRTSLEEFTDAGLITTRAGVKLTDVLDAVEAICAEYRDVRTNGVTDEELENAKNYLIGKIDLNTEDTEEVAHHFSKHALLYGNVVQYEAMKQSIRSVTKQNVETVAQELLKPENIKFCGIGPAINEDKLKAIIQK